MKYVPSIVVTLLIIVAVLIPGSTIPNVNIIGFDKIVHVTMFFTWAAALHCDFPRTHYLKIIFLGLAFSVSTELLQLVAEDRSFDWYDMVADGIGLCVGLLMASTVLSILFSFLDKISRIIFKSYY
jgi:VanZ family protein